VLRRDRDGLLARIKELLAELAKARAETKDLDGRLVAARRLAAVADKQEWAAKLKAEIQAKEDALARVTELGESNEALRRALEQQTKLKADLCPGAARLSSSSTCRRRSRPRRRRRSRSASRRTRRR